MNTILQNQVKGNIEIPISQTPFLNYKCEECETENQIQYNPFQAKEGEYHMGKLVYEHKVMNEEEVFKHKLASEVKDQFFKVGGRLVLLCQIKKCTNCSAHYLNAYSIGEWQPSRESIFIKGVWRIKPKSDIIKFAS